MRGVSFIDIDGALKEEHCRAILIEASSSERDNAAVRSGLGGFVYFYNAGEVGVPAAFVTYDSQGNVIVGLRPGRPGL